MVGSVWECVGRTPLIKIESLSRMTGCQIFGKAEFLNPGGSVKDRAAKSMIANAEAQGRLKPGDTIVEGSAGNTGIGLTMLGRSRGYRVVISIPDNQSEEKYQMLTTLGAELIKVPAVPFADPNHFFHTAKKYAETNGAYWCNQFDNTANFQAHYETTGPEIWDQTKGGVSTFITSAGTGGTIAGVSCFLKEKNAGIQIVLADPFGSGLYSYLKTGELKAEGASVTEGIGIMRLVENFKKARIDSAVRTSDQDMIDVLDHVAKNDGIFLGLSAALNVAAAYRHAQLHPGETIVTTLCDLGTRYSSKLLNPEWLAKNKLAPKALSYAVAKN